MTNSKKIFISKKISFVIPSFNGKHLLKKNLPKIIKNYSSCEIIVVDDGSGDGTKEYLEKQYPKIKLLVNKENLGFASTANRGIIKSKSPLVWLLNNDCYPQKNFLKIILPYFKDPKTFSLGLLEKINSKVRGRGVGGFKKGLFFHKAGKLTKNNTLWNFGASTIYNKQIFEKLGGFDENFNPFYWEDFDLSYRALKSGFKIFFEKNAVVYHQESSTINKCYSKREIETISFRNQLFTCWKNITDWELILKHFFWLPYHLILTTIKTQGSFFKAFLMAGAKLASILKSRRLNDFIYSDKEILDRFKDEI